MGFLDIQNKGNGNIGELSENWSIIYNTSPAVLGMDAGRIGSLTFSSRCDETAKFTIDNYLSVRHYFDNQVTRWLSTFDVNIRSVDTNEEFASFTATSRLSQLDVVRKSSANPSGTYQRKMIPPAGKSYTVAGTPYVTPDTATIYDVAAYDRYVFVLASGSHGGEVVHRFGVDGYWYSVSAVYSDAADLASPDSRHIAVYGQHVWVTQPKLDRVKRFTWWQTLTFVDQFGSAGTGNGQFDTISAIAVSNAAVYVADSVLGRIQRFGYNGTYVQQFGTAGVTEGDQIFDRPNSLYVKWNDSRIFVGDMKARVREYTVGGIWISNAFGGYDFWVGGPVGPMVENYRIGVGFDALGNAYCAQAGRVYKFSHDRTANLEGSWQDGARLTGRWSSFDSEYRVGIEGTWLSDAMGVYDADGILHFVDTDGISVLQYAGSTTTIESYILYYIALAVPDFPCRILSTYDPRMDHGVQTLDFPEWEMSVWQALVELCAVTGNAMSAFDDRLDFFNRANRGQFDIPADARVEPLSIETRQVGQRIEMVNYNARRTNTPGVMYSAADDGNRTFSANIGSIDHVTVFQDTYPEYLIKPQPQGSQVNPFSNPSVETDLTNLGYYVPSPGTGTLTRQTTAGFTNWGTGFARLQFTSAVSTPYSYISNQVDVLPGVSYDFSAYGRVSGLDQQLQLWVSWRNSAGQSVGWVAGPSTTATSSSWTYLGLGGFPAVAPPSASFAYVQVRTAADGRAWSSGQFLYADMWANGLDLLNPTTPMASPGRYTVYDSNNVLVDPYAWLNFGGNVEVERGERPGEIVITVFGPGLEIPGTQAPYGIRAVNGGGSFSILGAGIISKPETLKIGTGVTERTSSKEVAASIDSVHAWNRKAAYDEGVWAAYRAGLAQTLRVTMRIGETPTWVDDASGLGGTSTLIGRQVRYKSALYIIEAVEANGATFTIDLRLHTSWGLLSGFTGEARPDVIWNGKTAAEFDTYWLGYTSQDNMIAPLMNEYGV